MRIPGPNSFAKTVSSNNNTPEKKRNFSFNRLRNSFQKTSILPVVNTNLNLYEKADWEFSNVFLITSLIEPGDKIKVVEFALSFHSCK